MRRAPALTLAAAAAVYGGVSVTYALTVPVGSSADELIHLNYARLIAGHAALPGETVRERQQPPLYYLLSAGLLRAGAAPVALRFLSVALGALAIACVVLTVRQIVPGQDWLAAGSGAALALVPGFQFVSGSITDDSLAAAAGALLLLVTARVACSDGPCRRLLLAAGCSVGVALLAKETDLPVILVLAGVVAWRWGRRLSLLDWVMLGLPVLLIAGWWYARNLVAFHRPLPPLTPLGVRPDRLRTAGQLRAFATQSLHGLFTPERFQGAPLNLPAAGRVLLVVVAAVLAALAAAAAVLAARSWRRWGLSLRTAVCALSLAAVLTAALSVANAVVVVFQPQGRYLLVAATGPLLAVVGAMTKLARGRARVAAASALAASAIALSILGLSTAIAGTG